MDGMEAKTLAFTPVKRVGPPKVWNVVESVKKNDQGESIKFSIQEIPEDRYEDVLQHMSTYFIADEATCRSIGGKDNPLFVQDFRNLWEIILKQGLSVAAFVDDPKGGKPIIAGVNVIGVEFKGMEIKFEDYKITSPQTQKIMTVIMNLSKQARVCETYDVDRYMFALGLSVDPSFRGQALGYHLLKARENIGREHNIQVTSTAFTSPVSQKLAERAGFEVLLEKDYDQIFDDQGELVFPNIEPKTFKIMGRRLY